MNGRRQSWGGWLRHAVRAATGQAGYWVTGMAASVVRRGFEAYAGMPVDAAIAQLLGQFVELNIDTTTHPIIATGTKVRLRPKVKEMIRTELALELNLDRSGIADIELVIDVRSLLTGDLMDGSGADAPSKSEWPDQPDDPTLIVLELGQFRMRAPGVQLVLHGLHIELRKVSTEAAKGSIGGLLQKVLNNSQKQLQLLHSELVPGFVASIISDWILMGLVAELNNLSLHIDARDDALPSSRFTAELDVAVQQISLKHTKFAGRHLDNYLQLLNLDKYAALSYHLLHLPFEMELDGVECRLGDIMLLQLDHCGGDPQAAALRLDVKTDNWTCFDVQGTVSSIKLLVGRPLRECFNTSANSQFLDFRFCTMLDRIVGNREVLLQCYQQGRETSELTRLQERHSQLEQKLAEQTLLLRQLQDTATLSQGLEDPTIMNQLLDAHEEAYKTSHQLEIAEFDQVRFYEQRFWAYFQCKQSPSTVKLDATALTQTVFQLSEYSLSWIAQRLQKKTGSVDQDLIDASQIDMLLSKILHSGIDRDLDGEISSEEWDRVVGKPPAAPQAEHSARNEKKSVLMQLRTLLQVLRESERCAEEQQVQQGYDMLQKQGSTNSCTVDAVARFAEQLRELRLDSSEHLADCLVRATRCFCSASSVVRCNEPIGIQLSLELALPALEWRAGDAEMDVNLGMLHVCCPQERDECGAEVPSEERSTAAVDVRLSDIRAVVRDATSSCLSLWEGMDVLYMPPTVLCGVFWSLRPGAIWLLPSTVTSVLLEVWCLDQQGTVCCTSEPIGAAVTQEAHDVFCELCAATFADMMVQIRQHSRVAGVPRTQIEPLAREYLMRQAYMHWVLPMTADPNTGWPSVRLRVHCRVAFLALSHIAIEDGSVVGGHDIHKLIKSIMKLEYGRNLLSTVETVWSSIILLLIVDDFRISLFDPEFGPGGGSGESCVWVHHVRFAFNSARLRHIVDLFDPQALFGIQYETLDDIPAEIETGMLMIVEIPSPAHLKRSYISNSQIEIAAVTVRPQWVHGALDGVAIWLPSMRATLRHTEALVIDMRVVRANVQGIVATLICQHELNRASDGLQLVETLAQQAAGQACHKYTSQLASALAAISQDAIHKCEITAAAMQRIQESKQANEYMNEQKRDVAKSIQSMSLSVGELHIKGLISESQQANWLWMYSTDAKEPLWSLHGSLASPREVLCTLERLLSNSGLEEQTAELVGHTIDTVRANAIDYHTLGLADCTVLLSLSPRSVHEVLHALWRLFAFKPPWPGQSYSAAALKSTRIDFINLWPSLCFLNRTEVALMVPSVPHGWIEWSWWAKSGFVLRLLLTFMLTMDILPALVSFVDFMSFTHIAIWPGIRGEEESFVPAVFMFAMIVVMRFTTTLFTPAFFFALTGRWSRWYAFLSLLTEVFFYCVWCAPVGEIMTYPFSSLVDEDKGYAASGFPGTWENTANVEVTQAVFLAFEIALAVHFSCSDTAGTFTSKLRAPASQRIPILFFGGGLWLFWGAINFALCVSEDQVNIDGETVAFVFPPDEGDCNKLALLWAACCRLLKAAYAFVSGRYWSKRLMRSAGSSVPSADTPPLRKGSEAHSHGLLEETETVEVDEGLDKVFVVLTVMLILEQLVGCVLQQWKTYPLARNLGKSGYNAFCATTTDPANSAFGKRFCMIQNFELTNSFSTLIWLMGFLVLQLYWKLRASKEKIEDRVKHEATIQRQLDELHEREIVEYCGRIHRPPRLNAPAGMWEDWINNTEAAITTLKDTMGDEEGIEAAIQNAKRVIYGQKATGNSERRRGDFGERLKLDGVAMTRSDPLNGSQITIEFKQSD